MNHIPTTLVVIGLSLTVGAALATVMQQVIVGLRRTGFQLIPNYFLRVHQQWSKNRLYRIYGWSIPVLLVYTVLRVNALYNYDMSNSYDWGAHFVNTLSILNTGTMPDATNPYAYQKFQAPLWYAMSAWLMQNVGMAADKHGSTIPQTTFILSMIWAAVFVFTVQILMRRIQGLFKACVLAVLLFMPVNVLASAMDSNDLPSQVFMTIAVVLLLVMLRTRGEYQIKWWIRIGVFSGIAIAFKNTGVLLLAIYAVVAGAIILRDMRAKQWHKVGRVVLMSGVCSLLIFATWIPVTFNVVRYGGHPFGVAVEQPARKSWEFLRIRFLTTLDLSLFNFPFASDWGVGPGDESFWTVQHGLLHGDYYHQWRSVVWDSLPEGQRIRLNREELIIPTRFNTAVTLQLVAIPISLVMVLGFIVTVWRTLRNPRHALRDGSLLIAALIAIAQLGQFQLWLRYGTSIVIQPRYSTFVYVLALIVGYVALYRAAKTGNIARIVLYFVSSCMIAYTYLSFSFFWLPPR
jgi:hypothetical protein